MNGQHALYPQPYLPIFDKRIQEELSSTNREEKKSEGRIVEFFYVC